MCGIFGAFNRNGSPLDLRFVQGATSALRHRGPDDEGYLIANTHTNRIEQYSGSDTDPSLNLPSISAASGAFDLAFGFRRLSILDVSPAGHQPMPSSDGTCWIVYNGEIYNYIELRNELVTHGYNFQTGTDTEVILAAYQHWGPECLKHFTGMWAFAILDTTQRRMFLARDRFGIKPLYYHSNSNHFVFASEIKALLHSKNLTTHVNPNRLYHYLTYGITDYGDETLFADIKQLPSAHYLIVPLENRSESLPRRYWQIDLDKRSDLSFEAAASELKDLFLESVRLHLRSDVPVGAALSGGIDSSAIVTAMRHHEPELDLHTFSYIAGDGAISEERWVDAIVQAANTRAHKVKPSAEELVADLDNLLAAQDEPFGSTSIYAQNRVFRLAGEAGIKVMLDGQGADELLAGYPYFLTSRFASLLSQLKLLEARRLAHSAGSVSGLGELRIILSGTGLLAPKLKSSARRLSRNGSGDLNLRWFEKQGVPFEAAPRDLRPDFLRGELANSLLETSLPMLLRYEDRNSMAHSIESRVPFLTHQIIEFVFSLPESYLIGPDGESKRVFRKAMEGVVPDQILRRRDKIGFSTPERKWLTALKPWVDDILNSESAEEIPALNLKAVRSHWNELQSAGRPFDFRVWRWLNVIRWSESFAVKF